MLFYEDDTYAVDAIVRFLGAGIRARQPLVVIATPLKRRAIAARLRALGAAVEDTGETRDYAFLDARETLSAFMEGHRPSAELFDATVGRVIERLGRSHPHALVRAYGEMVQVLWSEGLAEAALELEDLWNALARKQSFSLLCAYSVSSLHGAKHPDPARAIASRHDLVLPLESPELGRQLDLNRSHAH